MSDIIVKFKPSGHKQLINAIKKLETAQKGASNANNDYQKSGNGALKTNRLLGSSFATIRSHMLLYSFGMSLGLRQTIEFTKQAAKIQQMEKAFSTMSGGVTNASMALGKLQRATNGTLSSFDLFQQANNAMILGVTRNSDEMARMFDMAQRLGDALGKDVKLSVESLVTGIGRQSRLMLDNIGIIVKADQAYADYARNIGKSADTLTDAEKKQAFMNAALEAGEEKLKTLPDEVMSASQTFQQLSASFSDAGVEIGEAFLPTAQALANAMIAIADSLDAERVSAYAKVITVALVGAMIAYNQQLRKAIINQSRLGWGLLITTLGVLGTELLLAAGAFDDYTEEVEDAGAANIGYLNTLNAMKKAELVEQLSRQKSMLEGMHPEYHKLIKEEKQLTAAIESGTLSTKRGVKGKTAMKNILSEQEKAERRLLRVKELLGKLTRKDVDKEEEEQLKKNIAAIEEQISVIDNGFTTYESYLEQGERANDMYKKTYESQLLTLESQIKEQQNLINVEGATKKHVKVLDDLKKKKEELIQTNILDAKFEDLTTNMKLKAFGKLASASSAVLGVNKKNALIAARLDQTVALINTYTAVTDVLKEGSGPMRYVEAAAALAFGLAQVGKIESALSDMGGSGGGSSGGGGSDSDGGAVVGGFNQGGYVPSSAGSGIRDDVPAMLTAGEFVMSRNAVDSIGLETLNQMNQSGGGGSINVNVSGNVLTKDFVEGELAESIKEAVRKGSDFGLS